MQLYIMRHGQANPVGSVDELRPLNEEGQLEVNKMAQWASNQQIIFDHVLVSPFIRAQQTCDIFLSQYSDNAPHKTQVDCITPFGEAKHVHDYIDAFISENAVESLLIISHMPLVSFLSAEMTVEQSAPIFQTAALLHIDYDVERMKGEVGKLTAPYDLSL